ncbi:MAG: peptide-methionine (S)-S-oxide reductase MsrA [Rhizobiaceae bacterium]
MNAGKIGSGLVALVFGFLVQGSPTSWAGEKSAIFAGGCFWCVEKDFEHVNGVLAAESGYTGGTLENPTYRNHTGHVEAVRITFDDTVVSYPELLYIFWRSVDPTDDGGQFCDRGHSYTTAIFTLDDVQMQQATASKKAVDDSGKLPAPIATPIVAASTFTVAEEYHQDYYKKNPVRYSYYRRGCGRDARVQQLWGSEAHAGIQHDS